MNIIDGFKLFKNGIENWFSVALNMFILKKDVSCKIRNVGEVKLKSNINYLNSSLFRNVVANASRKDLTSQQIEILKTYLDQFDKDIITITNLEDKHQLKFLNKEIGLIFEIFLNDDYKDVPYCENKILIDIGANIGDTPLYFANKGYNVYAFEPLPHIAKLARENIDLNTKLKNKITYINKAVSCRKDKIVMKFEDSSSGNAGEFIDSNHQVEVDSITINDVIEEFDIAPDVLKMDCEGCEVGIIKNSDLSMFSEIIFEYHTHMTGVENEVLINFLEKQGFKLNFIDKKTESMGIIHMIK